jgi:hypothetical protein
MRFVVGLNFFRVNGPTTSRGFLNGKEILFQKNDPIKKPKKRIPKEKIIKRYVFLYRFLKTTLILSTAYLMFNQAQLNLAKF